MPFDGGTKANSNFTFGNQTTSRFLDLDPNNIENISILKGLSATTFYGEAGRNGVILITTKKGARGLGITVNSGVSFNSVDKTTFAKYQKEYGGGYGAYYEDPTGLFLHRDIDGNGALNTPFPTPEIEAVGPSLNGKLS